MSVKRQYFGTDGIRGRTGQGAITPEFTLKLGWAVGQLLQKEKGRGAVLIGKDTRISGDMLTASLTAGFIAAGLEVQLLGTLPTPAVAYLTRALGAQMGVVVSASHNPYYDNGIKFFCAQGKKLPDEMESKIEALLSHPMTTVNSQEMGCVRYLNEASNYYIAFCKKAFLPAYTLNGLTLVIDCSNGATSEVAPEIFSELGAQVIAIHHQPDGFNINEQCGSTHPQALQEAVLAHQADLGIAFDGDGDRVILVDHQGEIVDGDEIVYVIAQGYQARKALTGGVVGTQMSNLGLENALKALNIDFMRTQVGDRYVLEGLHQRGWQIGGEASGHILCLDKSSTGDGILSALQVLGEMCHSNRSLHELKKGMAKCAQILLNVPVENGAHIIHHETIQRLYQQAESALLSKGRILLRPSGTEPLMRVMVEGEDESLISQVAHMLAEGIEQVAKNLQTI